MILPELDRFVYERQFNDFMNQWLVLEEWFNDTYPEATLRIEPNADKRHDSPIAMTVRVSVMTGKEATPKNQGFFQNTLQLTKEQWVDTVFMSQLTHFLVEVYKEKIDTVMNKHYQMEKERNG